MDHPCRLRELAVAPAHAHLLLAAFLCTWVNGTALASEGTLWAEEGIERRFPHIPTENELKERLHGKQGDSEIDYQKESVRAVGTTFVRGRSWLQQQLAGIHITPTRFILGLGAIGVLYTWNKNKHKVPWAVLSGLSYLLLLLGSAAFYFHWPYMN
jgi:hypothetical protein